MATSNGLSITRRHEPDVHGQLDALLVLLRSVKNEGDKGRPAAITAGRRSRETNAQSDCN